jgi:hypothetical protein
VHIAAPEMAAPVVNIDAPITVEAAPAPSVTVTVEAPPPAAITLEPAAVNITVEAPAPQPAEVVIHNQTPAPIIDFKPTIEVAPSPAPDVHVINEVPAVTIENARPPVERVVLERDKDGFPLRVVERPIK